MTGISLSQANSLIDGALAEAAARKLAPLAVVVLDPGGHIVAAQRQDGCGIMRIDIATAKAWGALGMGFGSRELAKRAASMPAFINAISAVSGGRLVPVPGGVLILDRAGVLQGAIGISGDTSDNDEICAIASMERLGLVAQTGLVNEDR